MSAFMDVTSENLDSDSLRVHNKNPGISQIRLRRLAMAKHSGKRDRGSHTAKGRRRGWVVGPVAAAGTVVAFGMSPLSTAPPAHADGLDAIIDSIAGSIAGLVDPSAGLDLGALGAGLAEPLAALGLSTDAVSAAGSFDSVLHTLEQDWITNSLGAGIDTQLNTLWQDLGGTGILIGNGANGIGDGSLAEATGGAGGIWFGDGGDGDTDAAGGGGAGGAGGDVALVVDGGAGGHGGDGLEGSTGQDATASSPAGIGGEGATG